MVLDANDNAPTWHNYDRLRRKHSSMESEGVPMDDENENINSVIPTYTVKGKILYFTKEHEFISQINLICNDTKVMVFDPSYSNYSD